MTLMINNKYVITGNPDEIAEFIKRYEQENQTTQVAGNFQPNADFLKTKISSNR